MINVSLIILCALMMVALARRQSAALRHWILAVAIGCAAVSPFLDRIVPAFDLGLPGVTSALTGSASAAMPFAATMATPPSGARGHDTEGPSSKTARPVATWLSRIWLAGSAVSFLVLLLGIGRLVWISGRAERVSDGRWRAMAEAISRERGLRRGVIILQSRHPSMLITWGVVRPRIMLPAGAQTWPDARIRVVLSHELAHIQRGDWVPQLLAVLLHTAFWFNPLVWIASRRLRLESEQACDDAVLRSGIDASEYAAHLLDIAREARQRRPGPFPGFPAPAMARPCSLERRVTAMLNTHLNRTPTTQSGRLVTALVFLAFTVLAGAAGARAQGFATFSGSIVDPMNAVVPEVTVVLTNVQNGAKYEVRSDRGGRFEFTGLAAGDYSLEAKLPGFAVLKGRVTVSGQNLEKDLTMQLGLLEETITVAAERGAATPVPLVRERPAETRGPRPCTPTSIGGNIRAPRKIKDVRPLYPPSASDAGVGGAVIVDARIGPGGFVNDLKVREAASADLAGAAADAIRLWEFTPTLLNCTPVDVMMKVTVNFVPR
jgi:beta-lactamase regulating signal transducer with metallopeptidase domain